MIMSFLVMASLGVALVALLFTFPSLLVILVALVLLRAAVRRRRHRSDAFVEAMLR